jgi:PAS domain S-box-containing protein
MATGLALGGDVEQALESVAVPSYVLDETGIVRWINPAAERLLGDIRGRHYTSVVAPEETQRAHELISRKLLGTASSTEAAGFLVSTAGTRVPVELSAVPLMSGERVVGVFGLMEELPDDTLTTPPPQLTPRQVEVLRLLEQGRSTKQIAAELHLSIETVRNHIRRLFRALGVHSRLEAVAAARAASPD